MGFAGVRESFVLVNRVHAELKVGGGEVECIGYNATAHQSVGDLGLASACGVELRGDGFRTPMLFLLFLSLSFYLSICEFWNSFEGKMRV